MYNMSTFGILSKKYIKYTNTLIKEDLKINKQLQIPSIKSSVTYALRGGKRFRPIIINLVSNQLYKNKNKEPVINPAEHFSLHVEYTHTSSLMLDDMPFMDNDKIRRNKKTCHLKFGAQLTFHSSLHLKMVADTHLLEGLRVINDENHYSKKVYKQLTKIIHDEILYNLGVDGISGGQFEDLQLKSAMKNLSIRQQKKKILSVIKKKTGSLFRTSFLLGWIAGGGGINSIKHMRVLGDSCGICFQIIDDLKDIEKDKKRGDMNNIFQYYTKSECTILFIEQLELLQRTAYNLHIWNEHLKSLVLLFQSKFANEMR